MLRCDIPSLLQLLPEAVEAKDLPGMADVDSSLLYFCRKVAERHTVALSGECADEVFGGYPGFERSELLEADTFPWCPDLEFRRAVVKPELWESLQVEDYVQARYQQSLAEMPAPAGRPCGNAAAGRSAGCPPELVHVHPAGPEGPHEYGRRAGGAGPLL